MQRLPVLVFVKFLFLSDLSNLSYSFQSSSVLRSGFSSSPCPIFFEFQTIITVFTSIQVYVADIEGHEGTRSTMNECAYYVISKAGGTPYAGAVAEKQKHLNDRWRALCQQLGITYKKAEETRYGLKLLEIQLKQLNTWMAEVESRLMGFTETGSCVLTEIQKKAKEMKVLFVRKIFCQSRVSARVA